MMWIVENWILLLCAVIVATWTYLSVNDFLKKPNETQIAKIREWLIWACIEAERSLKSGTGQLKLREVWNLFCAVPAFTWVAKVITFETFSDWVTVALSDVKQMIITNDNLAQYIYGEEKDVQVEKIREQLGG